MKVGCPSCSSIVELNGPPVRGNAMDGSDAWTCIKCKDVICVDCYHVHTTKKHPELLKLRKVGRVV